MNRLRLVVNCIDLYDYRAACTSTVKEAYIDHNNNIQS